MFHEAFKDKNVFVTGHTGFKGSWLSLYLISLGAHVSGYALEPPSQPNLFEKAGLRERLAAHTLADIRDTERLGAAMQQNPPDFVFHLAAQPLVLESYRNPKETFSVNVMGSLDVLEAVRGLEKPPVVIMVTTDKCYENREWVYGYRENDPLGGHDPYSASKAAMEIAVASYRNAFFSKPESARVATVRAGNIIGGGDWAANRILPDAMRAFAAKQPLDVRNPNSVRPWQHVLEPLSGYLWLAACLAGEDGRAFAEGWNFGPLSSQVYSVRQLVEQAAQLWGGVWKDVSNPNAPHEAGLLTLSIDKAATRLGWRPVWDFPTAVKQTVRWYQNWNAGQEPLALCLADIEAYQADAREDLLSWTI